jgi:hypothetical protein
VLAVVVITSSASMLAPTGLATATSKNTVHSEAPPAFADRLVVICWAGTIDLVSVEGAVHKRVTVSVTLTGLVLP